MMRSLGKVAAPLAFVLFLALVPEFATNRYVLHILVSTGIFIIAAMSLNLLLGYTGQLSLGHVAFFGIGAYTSALVSLGFDIEFGSATVVVARSPVWVGMVLGVVVAALFGWMIGKLAFRVRGAYFVIVTISFAQVMKMIALNWVDLTEGPMALNNIPPLRVTLPGFDPINFVSKSSYYYLVLVAGVLAYMLIALLVRSRAGRAFIALRENEPLARSVGISVTRYLTIATVFSAAICGLAGVLYTHFVRIVDPDVFLFIYTVTMVIMVVTGGKGTLAGPIVGGAIFGFLPEALREVSGPEIQWIVYGIAMIMIVFFLPQGIVPAVSGWWARRAGIRVSRDAG